VTGEGLHLDDAPKFQSDTRGLAEHSLTAQLLAGVAVSVHQD
jgi:hypothetical protein